jgi:formylglycine-generating enzyme required for sulfatase activity
MIWVTNIRATDITISNIIFQDHHLSSDSGEISVTFTVGWENSWNNSKNHDAAWIFFKFKNHIGDRMMRHGIIKKASPKVVEVYSGVKPSIYLPEDQTGIMIYPGNVYRGTVSYRMEVKIDASKLESIEKGKQIFGNVFGIEMVYIPKGEFFVGNKDPDAQKNAAAIHDPFSKEAYLIRSEDSIMIGTQKNNLWYINNGESEYRGDAKGVLAEKFPKGFQSFFIMKYELTDGQYCSFLNTIGPYYSSERANIGSILYEKDGGSIYKKDNEYKTNRPNTPAIFLSIDDHMAFADWAALRPMTELEYEKACRGPKSAILYDFPWGTNTRKKVIRYRNGEGLHFENLLNESMLSDQNLELFGASFYWVMDLNKSLWERCVTIGNKKGRSFEGSHGDGHLTGYYGNADNKDWPNRLEGGLSYRGGGTYGYGTVGSPEGYVSERTFGAWGDGPRTVAYGFRAVRSAK